MESDFKHLKSGIVGVVKYHVRVFLIEFSLFFEGDLQELDVLTQICCKCVEELKSSVSALDV